MPTTDLTEKYHRFGSVIATNRVAKGGAKIRFMYREEPDNEYDSGWRFFSGTENQEYADNPGNLAIYAITSILAIDPSIEPFLDTEAPCCFEREDENDTFVKNDDFGFEPEE